MKKRGNRQFLVTLVACIVLLSSVATSSMASGLDAFTPYDETVSISILSIDNVTTNSTISYDANDSRRVGPNDNVWIDAYKDYLNIEVTRIIADDNTALSAMVNTMMASGELPDVAVVNKALFYTMAQNGVLQDLTDVYAAYEHKEYLDKIYAGSTYKSGVVDGELLGLASNANFYNTVQVLWIRQDWLDAVGMEAPVTWDEMIAVAQAFVDNKLGGEDTIGIGLGSYETGVYESFDVPIDVWMQTEDGTYEYSSVSENIYPALLALQELYQADLISKDFATTSGTTLDEDIANGKCGMTYGPGWAGVTFVKNSMLNDPDARWIAVPIPTVTGEATHQWANASVDEFIVVNADYEYPEAVLSIIDLQLYLTYLSDMSETYYNYKDANNNDISIWNLRALRNVMLGQAFDVETGVLVSSLLNAGETDVDNVPSYAKNYFNRAVNGVAADSEDKAARGMYLAINYGYGIIYDKLINTPDLLISSYNGPVTETMTIYESSINSALQAARYEVIMGADISVYEKAIQDWYNSGGQTITDETNEYYLSQQ